MTEQLDLVTQIAVVRTAEELIAETIALKDRLKKRNDAFAEFCKADKDQIKANEAALLNMLNEQRLDSVRADAGTAYKSTITSYKIVDRDVVLRLILDNWLAFGNDMLLFNVQVDAVAKYRDEHGALPPGLTSDSFVKLNIRRS